MMRVDHHHGTREWTAPALSVLLQCHIICPASFPPDCLTTLTPSLLYSPQRLVLLHGFKYLLLVPHPQLPRQALCYACTSG